MDSNLNTRLAIVTENELGLACLLELETRNLPKKFDTQLFLSFLTTNFDSSIDHLQDALNRISSWMTANLLTLNSPKTEFLLICLKIARIHNTSVT